MVDHATVTAVVTIALAYLSYQQRAFGIMRRAANCDACAPLRESAG